MEYKLLKPGPIFDAAEGAAFDAAAVLSNLFSRPWYSRWGAVKDEIKKALPGDELVPHPRIKSTRAITIIATPQNIWPWLVQIGFRRAGWYSYDLLEELVGAGDFIDGTSAKRIIPGLQDLKPGHHIFMHPKIPALTVRQMEPEHILLFQTILDGDTGKPFNPNGPKPGRYVNCSWLFLVERVNDNTSRLIVRSRFDFDLSVTNLIVWWWFTDPISFVMERKMCLGIRSRAETLFRSSSPAAAAMLRNKAALIK